MWAVLHAPEQLIYGESPVLDWAFGEIILGGVGLTMGMIWAKKKKKEILTIEDRILNF